MIIEIAKCSSPGPRIHTEKADGIEILEGCIGFFGVNDDLVLMEDARPIGRYELQDIQEAQHGDKGNGGCMCHGTALEGEKCTYTTDAGIHKDVCILVPVEQNVQTYGYR